MKMIKITDNLTMVDESHLGGFLIESDPATFTPNLWKHLCETYKIEKVIDVGCGMGYAIKEFLKYSKKVVGIDGSEYVKNNSSFSDNIVLHDFTKGKYSLDEIYDLCWSSEFLEHVEEKYMDNYFSVFMKAKYCAVTYANKGQSGHHHVNCQDEKYWIEKFKQYGFKFLKDDTEILKNKAYEDALSYNPLYNDNHFYNRGLFFENIKL
jgi:SAM-dependent methyltransferase